MQAFLNLRASTMLGGRAYRPVAEALEQVLQPSWAGLLRKVLGAKIDVPKSGMDRDRIEPYRDELFWQTEAAMLLGMLRDPDAVDPLLRVMLDPDKADIQATALLALVKIGPPALEGARRLLQGEASELRQFHAERLKLAQTRLDTIDVDESCVRVAALVLGSIGRTDATVPLLDQLKRTKNAATRAILARELTQLPPTSETLAAYQSTLQGLQPHVKVPPGIDARALLTEMSSLFHQVQLLPWLAARLDKLPKGSADVEGEQQALLFAILKLSQLEHLQLVRRLVQKYGTKVEKEALDLIEPLLQKCDKRIDCYLAELEAPENQVSSRQFAGMKAAFMVGILGAEADGRLLVDRLNRVTNAAVRYTLAMSLDHLLPNGSTEVASRLGTILKADEQTKDRALIAYNAPLKQVLYRIQARGR
jgi:HEAT repeat protein